MGDGLAAITQAWSPSSTYQQLLTVWWVPNSCSKRLYSIRSLFGGGWGGTKNPQLGRTQFEAYFESPSPGMFTSYYIHPYVMSAFQHFSSGDSFICFHIDKSESVQDDTINADVYIVEVFVEGGFNMNLKCKIRGKAWAVLCKAQQS